MTLFLFGAGEYTNIVVWAICIGTNLGFLYTFLTRNVVGYVVRKLMNSCVGEENAKTLLELGYKKVSVFYKILLKDGGVLRYCVSVVGGQIPKAKNDKGEEVFDFASAKFYILPSNVERATKSYGNPQKWIFLPIFMVVSVALSYAMTLILPIILSAFSI